MSSLTPTLASRNSPPRRLSLACIFTMALWISTTSPCSAPSPMPHTSSARLSRNVLPCTSRSINFAPRRTNLCPKSNRCTTSNAHAPSILAIYNKWLSNTPIFAQQTFVALVAALRMALHANLLDLSPSTSSTIGYATVDHSAPTPPTAEELAAFRNSQ